MGFIEKLVGAGKSLIEGITDGVDRFVTTGDEKAALAERRETAVRAYTLQVGELVKEFSAQTAETLRAKLEAQKEFWLAELAQGDVFTKRARPWIIYAGLMVIGLELLGLRYLILVKLVIPGLDPAMIAEIMTQSKTVLTSFLFTWGGVAGLYSVGRSFEKRGALSKMVAAITGSGSSGKAAKLDDATERAVKEVMDRLGA